MAKSKKIITHPDSGREMKIDLVIYESIQSAILQSLKNSKGKTFSELKEDVVRVMKNKNPGFSGSIPWYTITIRLDLETKGIVETFQEKGKKLTRIRK